MNCLRTRSHPLSVKADGSKVQRVVLRPFEEIVGIYRGFERGSFGLSVLFDNYQAVFSLGDKEEGSLAQRLGKVPVGSIVGILLIEDDISRKTLVRQHAIEEKEESKTLRLSLEE